MIWAGDFNIVPCSPLYKFIKTSSTKDLEAFKCKNWTGQHSAMNVHTKMQSSLKRKMGIIGEEFDANKHGKYFHKNEEEGSFENLYRQICSLNFKLEGNVLVLLPGETPEKFQPLNLKSAYSEDSIGEGWRYQEKAGEIEWSTLTVQERYPYTVDYIL